MCRGLCSCLEMAHMGLPSAECSCRNRVTQMWQPLLSICLEKLFLVSRHRIESGFSSLGHPPNSPPSALQDSFNWLHRSLSCSDILHGSPKGFRG